MAQAKAKSAAAPDSQEPGGRYQPSEAEKAAAKKLLEEISRAKTLTKHFRETTLKSLRRISWGMQHGELGNADTNTRTNLVFATQATLLPYIYAKNPEISVTPTEAVDPAQYRLIKGFCQTAQVLLNKLFIDETDLKKRIKANIRSVMTTSVGWLKLGFQESLVGDPIIVRRVNDIQDNIRRMEYLAQSNKTETDIAKLQTNREELRVQARALMESSEVRQFKGFVLDRVPTEDILILDESIVEFDDYVHAKKLAMGVWMTDDIYKETFGHETPTGASEFGVPETTSEGDGRPQFGDADAKLKYRRIWQVWDKTANTVFTVVEGGSGYCRQPFVPQPAALRWYPFYCLAFNIVEGRWRPLADVELLRKLQDEYNTTRHLFAEARKEAIAVWVYRKSGNLTEDDIKKLADRKARQFIGVEGNPQVPLKDDIMMMPGIEIDPAAYDVTIIRNDMDMLVGLSDASRANLIEAKTATEAEIMRQALQNRTSERQDTNEDLISDMAKAALEIALQKYSKDEVMEIVGAGCEWPEQLSPEEIFRQVAVTVRAGSSGRPNMTKEREQWTAVMPILKETIAGVMELRAAGQFDMANAQIELLKETLRRFDERLDLDKFIPRPELDENGVPVQQQNAIAEAAAMKEDYERCKEELAACQQQVADLEQQLLIAKQNDGEKAAKVQSDTAIRQAQESSKAAEADAKAAEASARAEEADAKERAKVEETLRLAEIKKQEAIELARVKKEEAIAVAEVNARNRKEVAEIAASGKLKAAKAKDGEGGGTESGAPVPAEDNEYNAMAEILQKQADALERQGDALLRQGEAIEKLAEAVMADTVPSYDEQGQITRTTKVPRKEQL